MFVFMFVSCPEKSLYIYKNMNVLNRLETNYGKSNGTFQCYLGSMLLYYFSILNYDIWVFP